MSLLINNEERTTRNCENAHTKYQGVLYKDSIFSNITI